MRSITQSILQISDLNLKHYSTCKNRSSTSYRRSQSALDSQIRIGKRFARWSAEPNTVSLQFCCAQQQGVPDQLQPQMTSSTHYQSCKSRWEVAACAQGVHILYQGLGYSPLSQYNTEQAPSTDTRPLCRLNYDARRLRSSSTRYKVWDGFFSK